MKKQRGPRGADDADAAGNLGRQQRIARLTFPQSETDLLVAELDAGGERRAFGEWLLARRARQPVTAGNAADELADVHRRIDDAGRLVRRILQRLGEE